jgi:hypothetical protein
MRAFFVEWSRLVERVIRPGGMCSSPRTLSSPLAVRSRGGRRARVPRADHSPGPNAARRGPPKNAEAEFPEVSSMPKGCYEPWGLFRKPLGGLTVGRMPSHLGNRRIAKGSRRISRSRMSSPASEPREGNGKSPITRVSSPSRCCVGWFTPRCPWGRDGAGSIHGLRFHDRRVRGSRCGGVGIERHRVYYDYRGVDQPLAIHSARG